MASAYKFEAWVAEDPSAADGNMIWNEYTPKTWEETDMDIKVTHSAICATDLHVMKSDWVSIIVCQPFTVQTDR